MTADTIVRLKITLDDVEPEVLRRIAVPLALRLDRLHLAIQAVMGWTNSHLYEIRARDVGWGTPDPDLASGMLPMGSSRRRVLNQSTHSSVANSTASKLRHAPRR
jgi:hypothetical protein